MLKPNDEYISIVKPDYNQPSRLTIHKNGVLIREFEQTDGQLLKLIKEASDCLGRHNDPA